MQQQCFLSCPLFLSYSLPTFNFLLSLLQTFWKHHLALPPRSPSWEEMHWSEPITGLPRLGLVSVCLLCLCQHGVSLAALLSHCLVRGTWQLLTACPCLFCSEELAAGGKCCHFAIPALFQIISGRTQWFCTGNLPLL